jgi:guanylate kinase
MAIFLITAPSGVGKTSVMNYVAEQSQFVNIGECISHTTRPMRDGEEEGVTYYYVDQDEFEDMKQAGAFAEAVNYGGNLYGISKLEIARVLRDYEHVYIIVDFNGYKQVKEAYPEAIGIFLHATKEDCAVNMANRGDTKENIELRLSTYEAEMMNRYVYDYVVKNVRGKKWLTAKIVENIIMQYRN